MMIVQILFILEATMCEYRVASNITDLRCNTKISFMDDKLVACCFNILLYF